MKLTTKARWIPFIFFFIVAILTAVFSGCGTKPKATGQEDEIYVISDSAEYIEMEASLLQVFGKIIYTPQPEHLFSLIRKSYNELNRVENKKNVIIAAPLNSGSYVSRYINSILDSSVKAIVNKNDSAVFVNKYDLWARDQLVMILTAPDMQTLNDNILKEHDNLLYYFQKISNARLYNSLYNPRYEKVEVEARLLKKYQWIIYVQADFLLALDKPQDNFVWLRRGHRTDMERWIFVHWIENGSPAFLNPDSIDSVRNYLTEKYYRTSDDKSYVEIADSYKTTTEVNFQGRYALMTQGLWRFSDKSGGGPFVSYTFYDEASKRIYMLDGSIFAPKYYKKKLIQQVDVTLQSFKTENDLSPEKKEDLLDELE